MRVRIIVIIAVVAISSSVFSRSPPRLQAFVPSDHRHRKTTILQALGTTFLDGHYLYRLRHDPILKLQPRPRLPLFFLRHYP